MKRLLPILAALALAGCASTNVSTVGGHTMLDVTNTGWYLFNCIPLASGNPKKPNAFGCRPFSDTVTLENNLKLLDYAARAHLEDTAAVATSAYRDVTSYTTDESILIFLLKRHACHTSAELVRTLPLETK